MKSSNLYAELIAEIKEEEAFLQRNKAVEKNLYIGQFDFTGEIGNFLGNNSMMILQLIKYKATSGSKKSAKQQYPEFYS